MGRILGLNNASIADELTTYGTYMALRRLFIQYSAYQCISRSDTNFDFYFFKLQEYMLILKQNKNKSL